MASGNRDSESFEAILQSMGIRNYDDSSIDALREASERFAASIALDACEYAKHAKKSHVDADDITLALKLSNQVIFRNDYRRTQLQKIKNDVNSQDLLSLLDKTISPTHYTGQLMQQSYVSSSRTLDKNSKSLISSSDPLFGSFSERHNNSSIDSQISNNIPESVVRPDSDSYRDYHRATGSSFESVPISISKQNNIVAKESMSLDE